MSRLAALALLLVPAAASAGEVISRAPEASSLVIYRDSGGARATEDAGDGVALVVETRTVDLPAGDTTIRFQGVADTMVPQTAVVEGLPVPAHERNFDYDLLTPGALVAKAVGERVRLVRTLPGSGQVQERTGVIRAAPDGVLIETDEGVEAYQCSGLPERLVFERAPAGLRDSPTLSMQVTAPKAGRYTLKLGYLAVAFNWSADYVATLAADGTSLELHGWLTLANGSRTSFPAAPTQVVAGTLSRSADTQPVAVNIQGRPINCWPTATWAQMMARVEFLGYGAPPPLAIPAAPMAMAMADRVEEMVVTGARARKAAQSDLGDYKLYTLPDPTAVAASQIKQLAFLDDVRSPFDRVYRFRGEAFDGESEAGDPRGELVLKFQNEKATGLGVALPSGLVTVMQARSDGGRMFVGEQAVEDTPVGLPVELPMGASREVQMTAAVTRTPAGSRIRHAKTLSFRNTRATRVEVEVRETVTRSAFKLVSEDRAHTNRASDLVWTLKLAPGASAELKYTVEAD